MAEELTIWQVRAAHTASVRIAMMQEQLQRITNTPNAPQHKHADRVKKALDEWGAECMQIASRYIIAEGPETDKA